MTLKNQLISKYSPRQRKTQQTKTFKFKIQALNTQHLIRDTAHLTEPSTNNKITDARVLEHVVPLHATIIDERAGSTHNTALECPQTITNVHMSVLNVL